MPILYRWITALLAITGCFSLVLTREMIPLMLLSGTPLLPGYYRFLRGYLSAPKWTVSLFSGATLVVFAADTILISGDAFIAVAHLTITFQAIKSFDLKEPWDHLQVYFMSLLQLIIASELTRSLAFGAVFVVFMFMLVAAMVLSHFLKEKAIGRIGIRKPIAVISGLTLLSTILIFMILPRTIQPFFGKSYYRGIKTVGFSERVDFGTMGNVKLDPTVVMRIETGGKIPSSLYWRGIALDYFDGISWRDTERNRYGIRKSGDEFIVTPYRREEAVEQKIYLEPLDSNVIFGLAEVSGIKSDSYYLQVDGNLGLTIPRKAGRRVTYTAFSIIRESVVVYGGVGRYLQMPKGLTRLAELARNLTSKISDPRKKAAAIEHHLKSNYAYSLNVSPPTKGMSQIEHFIFESKRGFCEHYATSMVMMLRGIGIPARIVNGFMGGERNEYGQYLIVRQSNAHSWVEAFIDSRWQRFDPTPPAPESALPGTMAFVSDYLKYAWSRYVIGFSLLDQKEIIVRVFSVLSIFHMLSFQTVSLRAFIIFSFGAAALLLVFLLARRRSFSGKADAVTRKYLRLRSLFVRRGMGLTPAFTPGDIREAVKTSPLREDVESFLALYEGHRFGRKKLSQQRMSVYASLLKKIQREL